MKLEDLKKGDIVRIKTLEEIQHTLDDEGLCNKVAITGHMIKSCGKELIVSWINLDRKTISANSYIWAEEWLDLEEEPKKDPKKKTNDTYVPQPPTSREDFDYHIQKNRILTLLKTLTDFIQEDQKPKDEWWYELIDRYEGLFKSLVLGTESLFEEYQKTKKPTK